MSQDIEDDSGLVPGIAGVLTVIGDQVLLIGAEVKKPNLQGSASMFRDCCLS